MILSDREEELREMPRVGYGGQFSEQAAFTVQPSGPPPSHSPEGKTKGRRKRK
jgi:hypothetical protein